MKPSVTQAPRSMFHNEIESVSSYDTVVEILNDIRNNKSTTWSFFCRRTRLIRGKWDKSKSIPKMTKTFLESGKKLCTRQEEKTNVAEKQPTPTNNKNHLTKESFSNTMLSNFEINFHT